MPATPITDTLRKQYDAATADAAEKWQAFAEYREKNGGEKIGESKELFEEAERLSKAYHESADTAAELKNRLFSAMDMENADGPSLKDVGEDAGASTKRVEGIAQTKTFKMAIADAVDKLIESDAYKAFVNDPSKQSGAMQVGSLFAVADAIERETFKTLVTGAGATHGGVLIINDRQAGMVEGFDRIDNVMTDLITVGTTDSDTVEWVQMDSVTNNAAETPEAVDGDKAAGAAASSAPESAFALSLKSTGVKEIKHFIPATKRGVADAGQLRTLIDQELLRGLQDRLDGQILNGDGVGENLTGILNTAGIQTQAIGADTAVDAIHKGLTKLLISGYSNLTVLLNANDWQDIRLAKDANGQYFYGPPSVAGPRQVWGYPVVLSQRLTAGTGLAGDYQRGATLWLREGAGLSATDSHSDWFLKGIIAVLASMRAAFGVPRPRAFCTVTGI